MPHLGLGMWGLREDKNAKIKVTLDQRFFFVKKKETLKLSQQQKRNMFTSRIYNIS